MSRLTRLIGEVHRRSLWQVLLIYVGGAWACYELIDNITSRFALPEWLPAAAAILFLLGLPFVLATAYVQEGTPLEGPVDTTLIPASSDPGRALNPTSGARRLFTWRNAVLGGALAFGLWGIAATGWVFLGDRAEGGSGAGPDPRRVVVVPFEDRTENPALASLGGLAADWLTRELERALGQVVEVVPATTVREMMIRDSVAGTLDVARSFGAGTAITGTARLAEGRLQLEAEIVDAREGTLLQGLDPVSAEPDSVGSLLESLAERAVSAIAQRFDPRFKWAGRGDRPPPSLKAFQELEAGLAEFSDHRYREALPHFYRAHALDSTYVRPLLDAWAAHFILGYGQPLEMQRAESLFVTIAALEHRLSASERLELEWKRAWTYGDLEAEYLAAEKWFRVSPGTGYQLGLSAIRTSRPARAADAMSVDSVTGTWHEHWDQYWLVYAMAYHMLGRLPHALQVIEQGRQRLPDNMALVQMEIEVRAALGQLPEVNELLDRAFTMPPQSGIDCAVLPACAALEYRAHGHSEAAEAALQRALDWLASLPQAEAEGHLFDLARVLYWSGRWEEALPLFEALASEQPASPDMLRFLGTTLARLGRRDEALRVSERLAALDEPYLRGVNTAGRARIAAVLGDSADAVRLLRQAYREGQAFGVWIHREPDFETLREYPPFIDLVRPRG